MDSLLLTVRQDLGAMRLTIGMDFYTEQIMRSDANGTASVRVREGVLPRTNDEIFTVDDYEVAQGPVTYTLYGKYPGSSTREVFTVSGVMDLGSPWLGVPIMQSYSQPVSSVIDYGADLPGHASVHEPLGRTDPIVVLRAMGMRRGTLEFFAGTHGKSKQILASLSRGEVMMLRQQEHEGLDMYFVAESASVSTLSQEEGASVFSVSISYLEVARPKGYIASALGWDFAQIAAANLDFAEIAAKYQSFQALNLRES